MTLNCYEGLQMCNLSVDLRTQSASYLNYGTKV